VVDHGVRRWFCFVLLATACSASPAAERASVADAAPPTADAPLPDAFAADASATPDAGLPIGRSGQMLVFDSARGVSTLYDGIQGFRVTDDMWTFDGARWSPLVPPTMPPARFDGALVYDAKEQVSLLFGGVAPNGVWGDTWLWNGATWSQPAQSPAPLARTSGSALYDPVRQVVLYFGGRLDATSFQNDTWTWDGTNGWKQLAPAASPSPRVVHTMAFDPVRSEMVLFGGRDDTPSSPLSDTWTWDGATWTPKAPSTSPPGRFDYGEAWDPSSQRVIAFGGERVINDTAPFGDTWAWDGTTWTELHPAHSPSPRIVHGLVYDEIHHDLLLYGGTDNTNYPQDTWAWTGDDWKQLP
jgi:hypothetical protein